MVSRLRTRGIEKRRTKRAAGTFCACFQNRTSAPLAVRRFDSWWCVQKEKPARKGLVSFWNVLTKKMPYVHLSNLANPGRMLINFLPILPIVSREPIG